MRRLIVTSRCLAALHLQVASTINKVLTKTVGVPGFDNVAYAAKISALEEERLESG